LTTDPSRADLTLASKSPVNAAEAGTLMVALPTLIIVPFPCIVNWHHP
jgi:hypothetical protein